MPGHKQLIKFILQSNNNNNNKTLIEIGSTREFIPGHNSSEDFILLCKKLNMFFISVDMDPECSKNVINIAKKHNFKNYKIFTMKGEDFLKDYDKNIDYIYLDAFDFYHPHHSEKEKKVIKNF